MQGRLLGHVVVGQGAGVLQLLAPEDEALLVGRDALLVLDLGLHRLHGVSRLHVQRDGLARQGAHEDLHGWQLVELGSVGVGLGWCVMHWEVNVDEGPSSPTHWVLWMPSSVILQPPWLQQCVGQR